MIHNDTSYIITLININIDILILIPIIITGVDNYSCLSFCMYRLDTVLWNCQNKSLRREYRWAGELRKEASCKWNKILILVDFYSCYYQIHNQVNYFYIIAAFCVVWGWLKWKTLQYQYCIWKYLFYLYVWIFNINIVLINYY